MRLVYAYDLVVPDGTAWNYIDRPRVDRTYSRMAALRAVAEIARQAAELDPAIEVFTEIVEDGAVPALLNESIRAQAVVLGTRHVSAAGAVLLGSVSAAVAARAACPCIIVRGADVAEPDLPVVVGVDEPRRPRRCWDTASASRSPRRRAARVLCWRQDPLDKDLLAPIVTVPDAGFAEQAQSWLSEVLAGWQERFPTVPLRKYAVESAPTAGLLDLAAGAQLIIVGAHSRSPLVGTLLGSVSQGVLHHATCPVAVVPTSEH